MPTLYLVPTPIGNLEDVSFRILRTLKEVSLIAAEDTRTTRKLLNHFEIKTPLTSLYEHNELTKLDYILEKVEEGDVALVSEAGTPGISDPGYDLVRIAISRNIKVVSLPGPSAITTALSASGLETDKFLYLGFLPRKPGERTGALKVVASFPYTLVIFEAPHRLSETLVDIKENLGERRIAVCRELSKIHEEIFRGTISEAILHFKEPRGEFTLVISRAEGTAVNLTPEIEDTLRALKGRGFSVRDATALVSKLVKIPRGELYDRWLNI